MSPQFSLVFRTLDDRPAPVVLEDEDVADPDSRASHVSADTSIETITNDRHGRRQSRNSIYYASSGADRLLEPHTKVLTESEETDTDSGEGPLDLEKASLTSSGVEVDALRQLAPPHATLGTAPPPSSPHRHIHKNPGLSVTTTGRGTPGLPSRLVLHSINETIVVDLLFCADSPRERSPVSPLSPHSQSQLTQ